jgi:hypothetical protein
MDGWNEFMQSKAMRILFNGIVVVACVYYAVDAVMEMLSPERSAAMIEVLGATNFYLVDGARAVVCVICAIAFGRMLAKIFQEDE